MSVINRIRVSAIVEEIHSPGGVKVITRGRADGHGIGRRAQHSRWKRMVVRHHATRRGRVVRGRVMTGARGSVRQSESAATEEALDGSQDGLVLAGGAGAAHDVLVAHGRARLGRDRVVVRSRVGLLVAGVAGRRRR